MPQECDVLSTWRELPDADRERLLPQLLAEMQGWRAWAPAPRGREMWLEGIFEKAGVPYYGAGENMSGR